MGYGATFGILGGMAPLAAINPPMATCSDIFNVQRKIWHELCCKFTADSMLGKLPDEWKTGHITAVYKKGNKCDPCDYRPISLSSIICKLMESIIRHHIMNFFFENSYFSNKQYGFIKGRSTVLQLLKIMDDWTTQLDSGGQIDVIYILLSKTPYRHSIPYYGQ